MFEKTNQKQPSFQANGLLPSTVFGTISWRNNLALLGSSLHPWMFGGYDQGAEAPETFKIVEIERRNKKNVLIFHLRRNNGYIKYSYNTYIYIYMIYYV